MLCPANEDLFKLWKRHAEYECNICKHKHLKVHIYDCNSDSVASRQVIWPPCLPPSQDYEHIWKIVSFHCKTLNTLGASKFFKILSTLRRSASPSLISLSCSLLHCAVLRSASFAAMEFSPLHLALLRKP